MPHKGFLTSAPDCDEAVTGSAPDRHLGIAAFAGTGPAGSDAGPQGVRKFGCGAVRGVRSVVSVSHPNRSRPLNY